MNNARDIWFCVSKMARYLIYRKKLFPIQRVLKIIIGKNNYYRILSKAETIGLNYYYTTKETSDILGKSVIMMFDGKAAQTGLADNIRAIASVYHLCKMHNIQFKVNFYYPFVLSDYLIPNKYNWIVSQDLISYNRHSATPVVCQSYNQIFKSDNESLQRQYLERKILEEKNHQIHLYSNTYCFDEYFYESFHELFRPSLKLENLILHNIQNIGSKYISISFRFANLLDDIDDNFGEKLSADKSTELINHCIFEIETLHHQNLFAKKVLVTSDSLTFINKVHDTLDYAYIIPGDIGHVGHNGDDNVVLKTFLDLYLISHAEYAYMVRSKLMYRSGFAKRAAMIGNTPFKEIVI